MKKIYYFLAVISVFALITVSCETTESPDTSDYALDAAISQKAAPKCTTIQSGDLEASDGSTIEVGFDDWGYNYQAHLFNGLYCDSYRDAAWCQPYKDVELSMKWNDAWLSNKDCGTQNGQAEYTDPFTPDGKLDRHYGFESYIGSGAWITNHQKGIDIDDDGNECKWSYFVKIVAAPADAYKNPANANGSTIPGLWFNADDTEIGPVIWGQFAIIQQVYNDPCYGYNGLLYHSPDHSGFGGW